MKVKNPNNAFENGRAKKRRAAQRERSARGRNREEDCRIQLVSPHPECRWVTLTVFRAARTIAV
jgi:hypothetical protein